MSNSFYNHDDGVPASQSRGTSVLIRNELDLVEDGFDGVQTALGTKGNIAGQTWTGTHDFSGATEVKVPTPSASTDAATKAYADSLIAAAAAAGAAGQLPNQPGNAGKILGTDGATASWITQNPIFKPGMAASRYYSYPFLTHTAGGTVTQDRLYGIPFFVSETNTFSKIGINVSSAAVGGNARLGIYNMDSDALPSSLVLDAGTVSMATTGDKEISISQALAPGWYALACIFNNATAQVCYIDGTGAGPFVMGSVASPSAGSGFMEYAPYVDRAYGALPATFGTATLATITTAHPAVWMRI